MENKKKIERKDGTDDRKNTPKTVTSFMWLFLVLRMRDIDIAKEQTRFCFF